MFRTSKLLSVSEDVQLLCKGVNLEPPSKSSIKQAMNRMAPGGVDKGKGKGGKKAGEPTSPSETEEEFETEFEAEFEAALEVEFDVESDPRSNSTPNWRSS